MADIFVPDAMKVIGAYQQGQRAKTLADLAGPFAAGDYRQIARGAAAGGLGELALQAMGLEERRRAAEADRAMAEAQMRAQSGYRDQTLELQRQQMMLQERRADRQDMQAAAAMDPLREVRAREAQARQYGLDPNSEAGRAFTLTGRLPDQRTGSAPPVGYLFNDPGNPEAGLRPIPGGPAEKIDGEIAGRIGMAKTWLEKDAAEIGRRINSGVFGGPGTTAQMLLGGLTGSLPGGSGHAGGWLTGEATETFRKMQSGTEVLTRLMTGAGMNLQEAKQYAERYLPAPTDSQENIRSKFDQLRSEIEGVAAVAARGRGGVLAAPPPGGPATQQAPAPASAARDPLSMAREAISRGAPRDAVIQRLQAAGIDASGL